MDDERHLPALYDQMAVADLIRLQTAFREDRKRLLDAAAQAFCDRRLALIATALRDRGVRGQPN
jgi:hypothetical protein